MTMTEFGINVIEEMKGTYCDYKYCMMAIGYNVHV